MNTRSAKAKGRRLQQWVRDTLRSKYCFAPHNIEAALHVEDIESRQMGGAGVDVILSPRAQFHIPFDIECKNTETASPWAWMEQAQSNTKEGRIPLVVFKRNNSDVFCMLKFEDLLKVTR